ncbi:hypothetical protein CRG98_023777 [Punica granatum]|uniref:Uncharacterized protein n=1 Tax=Punica granatum TaxID=22663 RepID=A0A2I0JHX3_PUNGR|nr:hypothetical protein CRG98_023777 [Punica granatum]
MAWRGRLGRGAIKVVVGGFSPVIGVLSEHFDAMGRGCNDKDAIWKKTSGKTAARNKILGLERSGSRYRVRVLYKVLNRLSIFSYIEFSITGGWAFTNASRITTRSPFFAITSCDSWILV